jgi:hypothetical protein
MLPEQGLLYQLHLIRALYSMCVTTSGKTKQKVVTEDPSSVPLCPPQTIPVVTGLQCSRVCDISRIEIDATLTGPNHNVTHCFSQQNPKAHRCHHVMT